MNKQSAFVSDFHKTLTSVKLLSHAYFGYMKLHGFAVTIQKKFQHLCMISMVNQKTSTGPDCLCGENELLTLAKMPEICLFVFCFLKMCFSTSKLSIMEFYV